MSFFILPPIKPRKDSKIMDRLKDRLVYTTIFAAPNRTYKLWIIWTPLSIILLSFLGFIGGIIKDDI